MLLTLQTFLVALRVANGSPLSPPIGAAVPVTLYGRLEICDDFDGNSNLYGLGVRLGIYFQWVASVLTNRFLGDQAFIIADINSIVLLASFLANIQGVAQ